MAFVRSALDGSPNTPPLSTKEPIDPMAIGRAVAKPELAVTPCNVVEPVQTPEFDEYSIVLKGFLQVTHKHGVIDVRAGQAVHARPGEWIQYSTPEGGEYIAVCLPAFSPATVHRD